MNRQDSTRLHLPGGTVDRTNQLAFLSLSDGLTNTFVGLNAGTKFPASNNVFVGAYAGTNAQKTATTVYAGAYAGFDAQRVGDVVASGFRAAESVRDCYHSVFIGTRAGHSMRRAEHNTAIGDRSMAYATSGQRTVAIGSSSALYATATANSVFVGYATGAHARARESVFVGGYSGGNVYTHRSTVVGFEAGRQLHGDDMTVVGHRAAMNAADVSSSVILGANAASNATSISNCIIIGAGCSSDAATLANTIIIGTNTGGALSNATNNTIVGSDAAGHAGNTNDSVVIGYVAADAADGVSQSTIVGAVAAEHAHTVVASVIDGYQTARYGSNIQTSIAVGARAMNAAVDVANTLVIGWNAGATMTRSTYNTMTGALCADDVTDITETVVSGFNALQYGANVENSVCIGARSAGYLENCRDLVLVGHGAGAIMVDSDTNTFIGAGTAANVETQYSTVVGARNLNRRNLGRVKLSNVVVIGENIVFDLPITTVTATYQNAVVSTGDGTTYFDTSHLFTDPFVTLIGSTGPATGVIIVPVNEATNGTAPLLDSERDFRLFASLEMTDGSYHIDWYGELAGSTLVNPLYSLELSISSAGGTRTVLYGLFIESSLVASKQIQFPVTASYTTWLDVTIHLTSAGVSVEYTGVAGGATVSFVESAAVFSGDGTDRTLGFDVPRTAASHPPDSYADIWASSVSSAGVYPTKSAYVKLSYTARDDSGLVTTTFVTGSTHTVRGAGTQETVDASPLALTLVDPAAPGFTAVDYALEYTTRRIDVRAVFTVPSAASFGFEWLASSPMQSYLVPGTGYILDISVQANAVTVTTLSDATQLYALAYSSAFSLGDTTVAGSRLPIDIADIRAYPDVRATLHLQHTVDDGVRAIISTLEFAGYFAGDFEAGEDAQKTMRYVITTYDPAPVNPPDTTTVTLYANGSSFLEAQNIEMNISTSRTTPEFNHCVFIGSNFPVQRNVSNTFVVSTGEIEFLRATPNVFTIRSEQTRLDGHLTIGSSDTSNYLAFRGLYNDGYLEDIPTAYIGERRYVSGTEKSELLLAKGEDPIGLDTGPDRIRLVSGEHRLEVFRDIAANTYVYSRKDFESIAVANTTPLLIANIDGVYIPGTLHATATTATSLSQLSGSDTVVFRDNTLRATASDTYSIGSNDYMWTTVYARNGVNQVSDASLKQWKPLSYGVRDVCRIDTVTYRWKDTEDPREYYGVLADQVYDLFPELRRDGAVKTLNYADLIPVLINAVKDLAAEIEQLKRQAQIS